MYKELEIIRPKSSPFKLIQIGGNGDGGYLVPDNLENIESCFSPGVNEIKFFEDDLCKRFGIKCHMCDFSTDITKVKTDLIENLQTFEKKWLDPSHSKINMSLEAWINKYSPNKEDDLLLQMDIEGAEYENLLSTTDKTMKRFRIIVIELHGLFKFRKPLLMQRYLGPTLHKLDRNHICIHAHPNNCCGEFIEKNTGINIPEVIELTFLRRDLFKEFKEKDLILPKSPHELDIEYNVKSNEPIYLNENWFKGKLCKQKNTTKFADKLYYKYKFLEITLRGLVGLTNKNTMRNLSKIKRKLMKIFNIQ